MIAELFFNIQEVVSKRWHNLFFYFFYKDIIQIIIFIIIFVHVMQYADTRVNYYVLIYLNIE